MKSNASIFIVPSAPVFNRDAVPLFQIMDKEHSSFLYSTLYMNNVEVTEKIKEQYNQILCLAKEDEQFLPLELKSLTYHLHFDDVSNYLVLFKHLNEKYFSKCSKNLIIFSRSIALSTSDIQRLFDLLQVDEDSVLIGKAPNELISFIGFTKFHEEIFRELDKPGYKFEDFLQVVCKQNYFVTMLEKGLFLKNWNDFKVLYTQLSGKESLNYCSQKMHELFTHLFIEYKEKIK